jgi:MarR family transcriptional regulator, organic hydroperoxide resistance regulator
MRRAELVRYLVLAAQREGGRQLIRELKPLGVTASQAEVLRILGDHEPMTLTGLGEMLVCESGSNPSRLVDRLVAGGLVERRTSTADRRQLTLLLTERGRQAEQDVRAVEERLYADVDSASQGIDLEPVLELLRRFSTGRPAGIALENRIAAEQER